MRRFLLLPVLLATAVPATAQTALTAEEELQCGLLFAAIGGKSLSSATLLPSSSSSSSSSSDSDADLPPALNPNRPPKADDPFGDPFRFELWPAVPELARNTDPTVPKVHWILTVKIWYKVSMISRTLNMPD